VLFVSSGSATLQEVAEELDLAWEELVWVLSCLSAAKAPGVATDLA